MREKISEDLVDEYLAANSERCVYIGIIKGIMAQDIDGRVAGSEWERGFIERVCATIDRLVEIRMKILNAVEVPTGACWYLNTYTCDLIFNEGEKNSMQKQLKIDEKTVRSIQSKDYEATLYKDLQQSLVANSGTNATESETFTALKDKFVEASVAFDMAKGQMIEKVQASLGKTLKNWSLDYYSCMLSYETE